MDGGVFRVQVSLNFSAAHSLRNYGGKCERLHGHNFVVETEVEGRELNREVEILIDFKVLKGMLKEILEELDHTNLNDHPYFKKNNPSSENIAKYIFDRLTSKIYAIEDLKKREIRVNWVSVSENKGSKGIYARR